MKRKRTAIAELQIDRRLQGCCSSCGDSFALRDALLFYADETPPPEVEAIIANRKAQLAERRQALKEQRHRARDVAERITVDVNLGKILEKLAPVFDGFGHNPRDCRALFEPIDYVIFRGLAKSGEVSAISFVDVKTGGGALSPRQRQIRDVIEAGKVQWKTYDLEVKE